MLDEALAYIARDSHAAAERLLIEALDAASSLGVFSERGRLVPELNQPNVRELFVQRYRLLYEVTASEVHILAFVHGARDLRRSGIEG
jgi:plasmid stabilization system protein ParE